MREIEYIELIADNKFKEHIMPIFQKLEIYLDDKTEFSVDLLDEIRALLNDYELRGHISAIIKEAKADKSQILGTYAYSLQRNVTGYIKMENSELNVRRKKLAKLLLSYINVTRYIIDYNTIEELINRGPQNGEKLVLALGLVKIDEDDIKVNTEIDHIVELSRQNPMYFVIPIYGCSTNVFATINEKTHADIIHIAGHGANCSNGKTVICFTDANMTFDRLCKKIQPPQEIIFLNCCNTYEYVGKKPISIADSSIVHDGSVSASIALDFSDNFYTTFLQTGNLNTAWDAAKSVETPLKYYWL